MNNARRGFTMLEAMVALAIVGIVCVGVLTSYGSALRADTTAAERLPLAALATERLAAVDLYDGSLDRLPDTLARGHFAAPFDGAEWQVETRRVADVVRLFEVTVQVREGARPSFLGTTNTGPAFTLVTRRFR